MSEARIQASYARTMLRLGRQITLQRIVGQAPNATIVPATVLAIIQGDTPDAEAVAKTGYGAREPGGISQSDRTLIVMEADLIAQGFPLPVRKNDKASIVGTDKTLNVVMVDEDTRRAAGAIVLKAAGVA